MKNKRRLSRRTLLKTGLATGGAALLTSKSSLTAHAQFGSPATEPFVDALPIPPVAQPLGRGMPLRDAPFDPPPNPAAHQRYEEFS
jgi:hypothetical protein